MRVKVGSTFSYFGKNSLATNKFQAYNEKAETAGKSFKKY